MARQGLIEVKSNDHTHNHWENMTTEEKFKSTFKDVYNNKLEERKGKNPADILQPGYDTFDFVKKQIQNDY